MEYKKIIITDVHRKWKIHISPLKNFFSIQKNGLIRPDILKKRSIFHTSPYDVFKSTKNGGYLANQEKDAYTYFGEWGTQTFEI